MAMFCAAPTLNLTTSIPRVYESSSSSSSSNLSKSFYFSNTSIYKSLCWNICKKQNSFVIKATETNNEAENPTTTDEEKVSVSVSVSELGEEINKAMKEKERVKEESVGFMSGVIEEIGEIEWPDFGKVVTTTGVVLGVIAGSSVVLLTVNALLAELSDALFAGRGLQDFFSG